MGINRKRIILISAAALVGIVLVVGVLMLTHIICVHHDWQPATCVECEKCRYCGENRGDALGHKWAAATCLNAKMCEVCGKTQGIALGHYWSNATCTQAKICGRCRTTEGEPLGHTWTEATCTSPKTCDQCGATEGVRREHIPGNIEITGQNIISGYYTAEQYCTLCNEKISSQRNDYKTLITGNKLIATPYQLMERVENGLNRISGCSLTAGTKTVDGELYGVVWNKNGNAIFAAEFLGTGTDEILTSSSSTNLRGIFGYLYDNDSLSHVLLGFIWAVDPSLSFEEGKEAAKAILAAYVEGDVYDLNGIRYGLTKYNGAWLLGVTVISESENV